MSRTLIVNADDFGWDADSTRATIELIEGGQLKSATIMTSRPGTTTALDFASGCGIECSFGLHFNIVDGHQLADPKGASLHTGDGTCRASRDQRIRALIGLLRPADIQHELRAQLRTLANAGVKISHVDSHGHLHKFPSIWRAMRPVLAEFGISRVRRPQNRYARGYSPAGKTLNAYCSAAFGASVSTEYFAYLEDALHDSIDEFVATLESGTTELSVHPGWDEPWRRRETEPLSRVSQLCQEHDVVLASYWAVN